MFGNRRPGHSWKELLFLFVSDLIAILLLPYALGMLSLQWLAILLYHWPWLQEYDQMPLVIFTCFTIGGGLFLFGLSSNLQRYTLRLLFRYLVRASLLTFGIEAAATILSFYVMRSYPSKGYPPKLAITQGDIVFGIWLVAFLAYLWFSYALLVLPDPLPDMETQMVRGVVLENEDTIEARSWKDE